MDPIAIAQAVEVLASVLNTITNSVAQATQISSIIKGAQAQGRTTLTADEWAVVTQANASSREALVASINKAFADLGINTSVK